MLEQGDRALTFEEIIEVVRRLKPHFPPQDLSGRKVKVRYSDTNFILIIALIETVCGQPLHQVHADLLHKPLGLHHTYFPGFSQPLASTQLPVPLRADGQVVQIPKLLKSFRGIYSTAGNTIAFLRSLTRGEVFQQEETFSLMQSHWNRFGRLSVIPVRRAAGCSGVQKWACFSPAVSMKPAPELCRIGLCRNC